MCQLEAADDESTLHRLFAYLASQPAFSNAWLQCRVGTLESRKTADSAEVAGKRVDDEVCFHWTALYALVSCGRAFLERSSWGAPSSTQ